MDCERWVEDLRRLHLRSFALIPFPLAPFRLFPVKSGVMSYRSIKRVLGETSLERKCRFLFGACLLLLITASFWFYGDQTKKIVNEQNRNTGRLLVDQEMQVRHWKKLGDEQGFIRRLVETVVGSRSASSLTTCDFILPNLPVAKDGRAPTDSIPHDDFELAPSGDFSKNEPAKVDGLAIRTSSTSGCPRTGTSITTINRSAPPEPSALRPAISRWATSPAASLPAGPWSAIRWPRPRAT